MTLLIAIITGKYVGRKEGKWYSVRTIYHSLTSRFTSVKQFTRKPDTVHMLSRVQTNTHCTKQRMQEEKTRANKSTLKQKTRKRNASQLRPKLFGLIQSGRFLNEHTHIHTHLIYSQTSLIYLLLGREQNPLNINITLNTCKILNILNYCHVEQMLR